VKLENSFDVPAPPAQAWRVLTDVERIAPCVPGAKLTEVVDDRTYRGSMAVKLGPVSLSFDGTASFTERDDDAHVARMTASGREARNRGGADAEVEFRLEPDGDGTRVSIVTDLQLSGPVAQYGRSQGIIASVSEEMISRFAARLKEDILAGGETAGAATGREAAPTEAASGIAIGFGALLRLIRRFLSGVFGKG
jgi:carbon monoxide dehydrogenase subunit G